MIKIAICDDDRLDRESLYELVQEHEARHNKEYDVKLFESGEAYIESGFISDILFLDIVMEDKDGIQIGEEIKGQRRDAIIIYTTNLPEKMMVAFNRVHSFGYLVKPIVKEELFQMLSDAIEQIEHSKSIDKVIVTFPSENNTVIKLPVESILYFEYRSRKVKIMTKDKEYVCRLKINDIAEKMKQYNFMMSHQSFVVNLYYIEKFADQALIMKNGDKVYLAQKRASAIRKKLMQLANESGKGGESKE